MLKYSYLIMTSSPVKEISFYVGGSIILNYSMYELSSCFPEFIKKSHTTNFIALSTNHAKKHWFTITHNNMKVIRVILNHLNNDSEKTFFLLKWNHSLNEQTRYFWRIKLQKQL